MTFTYGDLKTLAKLSDAALENMATATFDGRSDLAVKRAFAAYEKTLEDNNDAYGKGSILTEVAAPDSGAVVVNTTVGDLFKIDLDADARKIADDTIFVYNDATAEFEAAKRIDLDDIVPAGAEATVIGFVERKAAIDLYVKQGTFATAPMEIHYMYWRHLTVPTADANVLDINAGDFGDIYAIYLQHLTS